MEKNASAREGWIYRPMQENEFDAWLTLTMADYAEDLRINHLYDRPKAAREAFKTTQNALPQGMSTPDHYFRTCECDGRPAGYLWFTLDDSAAFLMDIMLLPEFHGKGFGRRLMQAFIDEIKTAGAQELELRVSPQNERALNLYKSLGFRLTGYDMCLSLT